MRKKVTPTFIAMWLFSLLRPREPEISLQAASARAGRGAAYLDDVDPGWHERIDLDDLALASGTSCVLGQLHGDFRFGLGRSRLVNFTSAPRASLSPITYGFMCVDTASETDRVRDYELLDSAWIDEIRLRQASRGASTKERPLSRRATKALEQLHQPSYEGHV